MANKILLKRGIITNLNNVTPDYGEVILAYSADRTAIQMYVGDGNGGKILVNPDMSSDIDAAIKSGAVSGNTVNLYTSTNHTGTPVFSFDFPTEMFLDQTKTVFVDDFEWSSVTYPGSTNPNLDGKPVMVLAVSGSDSSVTYSFLNMQTLVDTYSAKVTGKDPSTTVTIAGYEIDVAVNISEDSGNILERRVDGLFVPPTDLSNYVTKDGSKVLSTNDYTTIEKNKLAGIEANANNYSHPASHAATMITEDSTHRFVSDTEKNSWNAKLGTGSTIDGGTF